MRGKREEDRDYRRGKGRKWTAEEREKKGTFEQAVKTLLKKTFH